MVQTIDNDISNQPHFEDFIPKNTIRAMVEFMLVTAIAEAAQPTDEFKRSIVKDLAEIIRQTNKFPQGNYFPNFANIKGKTGRSPGMDEFVKLNLHDVMEGKKFGDVFSESEFPTRKKGGKNLGRSLLHRDQNTLVEGFTLRKLADLEHD